MTLILHPLILERECTNMVVVRGCYTTVDFSFQISKISNCTNKSSVKMYRYN